jgi:ornithine decarboxylase
LRHCQEIECFVNAEGINIDCIDLGGGFPVQYCGDPINIHEFCKPIKDYLVEHFQGKKICAEPGRFLVASSMSLLTKIKGKSIRQGKPWYFIDDSIYHSFSGITFDHCDFPMIHDGRGAETESTIAGATCDSCDVIKRDILLPDLAVGDLLIFKQMGAYCSASASFFNGYPPTQIQLLN